MNPPVVEAVGEFLLVGDLKFDLAGPVIPAVIDGRILSESPAVRYSKRDLVPLNRYGAGPFGRFKVNGLKAVAALYALCASDEVLYIGETVNLGQRWSSSGYGRIQPRNCYVGGQQTNCRINALMLVAAESGRAMGLHYLVSPDDHARLAAETRLIGLLRPSWNR